MFRCCLCGAIWPNDTPYCGSCGRFNALQAMSEQDVQRIFLERRNRAEELESIPLEDLEDDEDELDEEETENEDAPTRIRAVRLDRVHADRVPRVPSGFANLDSFLSSEHPGIPQCATILVGGDPGIGKTSLLRQVVIHFARRGENALFASGEEAAEQVKGEFCRVGALKADLKKIRLVCTSTLEDVLFEVDKKPPSLLVLDSLQRFYSDEAGGKPRTPRQAVAVAETLAKISHELNFPIFIVCQVTKEDEFAGPETVKHAVDTLVMFEHDAHGNIVGSSAKNRFGSTQVQVKFRMTARGLCPILEDQEAS
jgi:DNA repair protein RadA/Sms